MTRPLSLFQKTFFWTVLVSALTQTVFPAIGFDPTFGSGGKFMTSFSDVGDPTSGASDIFIQPSGRIVAIGNHAHAGPTSRVAGIALAGLTPNGILDNSFGTAGKVLLWEPPVHRFLSGSAIQPDGSIIILCRFFESSTADRPALLKLTVNGQPDPTFNADINLFSNETLPTTLAIGNEGKIYVVVRRSFQHYIVRLNANGSRDTTFGPDGVRSLNLNRFASQPRVFALEELATGQLLIAGTYSASVTFEGQTFVARLNGDTSLDLSFGTQGAVRLGIPYGSVNGVTMRRQPDGKILIGGSWTFLGSTTFLVRLAVRGRIDADFGIRGFAQTNFNNWNVISGIVAAPDGTIFVSGSSGAKAIPTNQRLFLIRYSATGTIVTSVVTNFLGEREAGANDIFLQGDGKLLIGGFTQNLFDANQQLAVARFNQ